MRIDSRTTVALVVIGLFSPLASIRQTDAGSCPTPDVPAPLTAYFLFDEGSDVRPRIAKDSLGRWIAVWESNDEFGGPIGTDWDIFYSTSDDGVVWFPPTLLNSNGNDDTGDDRAPELATDGAGVWVVVWTSREPVTSDIDILFARSENDGSTWTDAAYLNSNHDSDTGHDESLSLATDQRSGLPLEGG